MRSFNTQILGEIPPLLSVVPSCCLPGSGPVFFWLRYKIHLVCLKDSKGFSDVLLRVMLEAMGWYFCKGIFMRKPLHRFSPLVWEVIHCPVPCLCPSFTQAAVNVKHGYYHPFSDSVTFQRKQQPSEPTLQAGLTYSPCNSHQRGRSIFIPL